MIRRAASLNDNPVFIKVRTHHQSMVSVNIVNIEQLM